MKRLIGLFVIVASSVAVTAGAGEVNCKLVLSNLKTGRTPQDVAETMVIPIDDVKKCQAQEGKAAPGAPPAKAGDGSGTAQPEGSKSH